MRIKIAGFEKESITDGKGMRYTVFTQGCPHACVGCHNPETHDFGKGEWMDINDIFEEFKSNPLLNGITLSGGEPFCQPKPLYHLAELVHSIGKDVTVYSGWTLEELCKMKNEDVDKLLEEVDVLIDGKFVEELKNLELQFRGSENQRVIDMNETRKAGKVVLMDS